MDCSSQRALALDVWGLREEARKSWEHATLDEVVYLCDAAIPNLERCAGTVDWFTKYQLRDTWLEYHIVLGGERESHFKAIIEFSARSRPRGDEHVERCRVHCEDGVLVDIAQSIQLPQGMALERCPSMVWLKRFDNSGGVGGDVCGRSLESPPASGGVVAMNRETGIRGRRRACEQGELPSKLIQSGSKSVDEVSKKQGDPFIQGLHFKPDDVSLILNIVLFRDGVWFGRPKGGHFCVKLVEVFFRPTYFHLIGVSP